MGWCARTSAPKKRAFVCCRASSSRCAKTSASRVWCSCPKRARATRRCVDWSAARTPAATRARPGRRSRRWPSSPRACTCSAPIRGCCPCCASRWARISGRSACVTCTLKSESVRRRCVTSLAASSCAAWAATRCSTTTPLVARCKTSSPACATARACRKRDASCGATTSTACAPTRAWRRSSRTRPSSCAPAWSSPSAAPSLSTRCVIVTPKSRCPRGAPSRAGCAS